jgi:hypothetical protein
MPTSQKFRLKLATIAICAIVITLLLGSLIYEFKLNQRQILFEVSYKNIRSGGAAGFYVDSEGNVYTFDTIPKTRSEGLASLKFDKPKGKHPYTTSDLFGYYGSSGQLAGRIESNTLNKMESLIQTASIGELSYDDPLTEKDCYSKDAGTTTYQAYLYNSNLKTHTSVELYSMGDFKQLNLSNDGRFLYKWLENICIENNYFSGCNSAPYTCKP